MGIDDGEYIRNNPILVLAGGMPYERDDIQKTVDCVHAALIGRGCRSSILRISGTESLQSMVGPVKALCFLVDPYYTELRDRSEHIVDVRTFLEENEIRYTGTRLAAAHICRDKIASKNAFSAAGVDTPNFLLVPRSVEAEWIRAALNLLGSPAIIKPVTEGSGAGVYLCDDPSQMLSVCLQLLDQFGSAMIEEFVPGVEVTVAVLGGTTNARVLPPIEICPLDSPIYDYEAKRNPDRVQRFCPARLRPDLLQLVRLQALRAHAATGAKGPTRIDFRVNDGCVSCLEINASPALGQDEHVPRAASADGLSYEDLVMTILMDSLMEEE